MKSFLRTLEISSSALRAERIRINTIASNIANINTTRTEEGGPYMRKDVIFKAKPIGGREIKRFVPIFFPFFPLLPRFIEERISIPKISLPGETAFHKVEVEGIFDDPRPPVMRYEPYHPDADENGYVAYPNINPIEEMVNLISAQRAFDANVSVVQATKDIALRSLEIGR